MNASDSAPAHEVPADRYIRGEITDEEHQHRLTVLRGGDRVVR
jgi:uncharacterized membrane protein